MFAGWRGCLEMLLPGRGPTTGTLYLQNSLFLWLKVSSPAPSKLSPEQGERSVDSVTELLYSRNNEWTSEGDNDSVRLRNETEISRSLLLRGRQSGDCTQSCSNMAEWHGLLSLTFDAFTAGLLYISTLAQRPVFVWGWENKVLCILFFVIFEFLSSHSF